MAKLNSFPSDNYTESRSPAQIIYFYTTISNGRNSQDVIEIPHMIYIPTSNRRSGYRTQLRCAIDLPLCDHLPRILMNLTSHLIWTNKESGAKFSFPINLNVPYGALTDTITFCECLA